MNRYQGIKLKPLSKEEYAKAGANDIYELFMRDLNEN
jgi:hypothetical protein